MIDIWLTKILIFCARMEQIATTNREWQKKMRREEISLMHKLHVLQIERSTP